MLSLIIGGTSVPGFRVQVVHRGHFPPSPVGYMTRTTVDENARKLSRNLPEGDRVVVFWRDEIKSIYERGSRVKLTRFETIIPGLSPEDLGSSRYLDYYTREAI